MRRRGAAFVFSLSAGKHGLSCRGVKFAGVNRPPLMDDLKVKRFLRRNCDLRLLRLSYILQPIVIRSQLKCVRTIWKTKRQRRILVDHANAGLIDPHHHFQFEHLTNSIARAEFRPENGDLPCRTFNNARRLVFIRGGSAIGRARGFAGLGSPGPSAQRHKRRLTAIKRRLGKSLSTRTSCLGIPKSSSVEVAEQRSDRFRKSVPSTRSVSKVFERPRNPYSVRTSPLRITLQALALALPPLLFSFVPSRRSTFTSLGGALLPPLAYVPAA